MSESVPKPAPVRAKTYCVWVTASKEYFAEGLVAKLVRRGFQVEALGRQLITNQEDNMSVVVAVGLFRQPKTEQERKEYNAHGIYHEVVDVLRLLKTKYSSIVVSASEDATWNIGNCTISAEEKEQTQAKNKVN